MVGDGKKQAAADQAESGRGLGFLSLGVGLATGGTAYLIIDRWIDASTPSPVAVTVLQSIVAFSAGWLLLSERRDFLRPLGARERAEVMIERPVLLHDEHQVLDVVEALQLGRDLGVGPTGLARRPDGSARRLSRARRPGGRFLGGPGEIHSGH